jgi:Holliday junction resolvase RusA-like endonuclease
MRLVFSIPGPPVGKGRPRVTTAGGHAHAYTPVKTASYERLVRETYKLSFPGQKPLEGPLELVLRAYYPIPESWPQSKKAKALCGLIEPTVKVDFDNLAKVICDSLNDIAWVDDKQIVDARIQKIYSPIPRVEVEIYTRDTEGAYSPK